MGRRMPKSMAVKPLDAKSTSQVPTGARNTEEEEITHGECRSLFRSWDNVKKGTNISK